MRSRGRDCLIQESWDANLVRAIEGRFGSLSRPCILGRLITRYSLSDALWVLII